MNITKWTPGPWFVCPEPPPNDQWVAGETIGSTPEGTRVADPAIFSNDERRKADARLIAAAPELYIALAAVLGWLDDNPTGLELLTAANHARHILAKARGNP